MHVNFAFFFQQFLSMGPAQREAVWRALKDDADKLLAESASSPDRESRKLQAELAECERAFARLSAEAAAKGKNIDVFFYLYQKVCLDCYRAFF